MVVISQQGVNIHVGLLYYYIIPPQKLATLLLLEPYIYNLYGFKSVYLKIDKNIISLNIGDVYSFP